MKKSYITKAFRKTVRERFPEQAAVPNSAFGKNTALIPMPPSRPSV